MYDPQIGRFWQIDPLGELGESWSPYSFVLDNPVSFNDPLGLEDSVKPMQPVVVTPGNNAPPCCQLAPIAPTVSPAINVEPPPGEISPLPMPDPGGYPIVEDPVPLAGPLAGIMTTVLVSIPITGNTDWPNGDEVVLSTSSSIPAGESSAWRAK